MAKKKGNQTPGGEGQNATLDNASQTHPQTSNTMDTNGGSQKKKPKTSKEGSSSSSSSFQTLNICRNKHWRYISSFHGPWLQMPIEILETIANINYNTPRPCPIDPAVLYDLLKIRRLVDEATNLAVRAASDIASPVLTNVHGGLPGASSMSVLGMTGPGHGTRLSRERKFRMREQASQKLSRAYHLDEIACSVATMQGASPIDEIGALVLLRNPQDQDAKYVHFFHEKIPSRQLAESTSLQPLTDIISERPNEGEALRTRAIVKTFKEDFEGAAHDLTVALTVCRIHQQPNRLSGNELESQYAHRGRRWRQDITPSEKDQPSSLESQLLFLRGAAYLSLACQYVEGGIPTSQSQSGHADSHSPDEAFDPEVSSRKSPEIEEKSLREQAEARKLVKKYAKWALRDLLTFMSHFEYAPNLPSSIAKDFNDRVNSSAKGTRHPRPSEATYSLEPHTTYAISELFAAVPPSDLPPYPNQEVKNSNGKTQPSDMPQTCEWSTYHPLMADALHSLLLCHCLTQTSAKELQRHTYMAARLIRLADGYPVFQPSRSAARSDWVEILRRADDNWLQLSASWETLCIPAPLPFLYDTLPQDVSKMHIGASRKEAAAAAASLINGGSDNARPAVLSPADKRRQRKREHDQRVYEALNDERVCDDATFRASIEAREKRDEKERAATAAAANGSSSNATSTNNSGLKGWSDDDSKDYPLCSVRASLIAQWVQKAPIVTGTTRRKKRTKKTVSRAASLAGLPEKRNLEDGK
ncbi:hypothetical protein FOXG_00476 [Fusarium oxysporum f. sp. lycopersici 4287]|uniref:Histidine kinase group protein n=3 Tax=Fusarium oxysporum TaxID=5507 RepID=A0A0J9U650_FUSO4|nr:hypothetical protein FOXG_00476 [Fusarium oxysporum f. sp. lycopersici 4287]EXK48030.1 hypothetical protein FOMG_01177 [Fusarium oxysporum f. sp. melonis 26406]KNA94419.1 hypothetical protein FOXG_00476 [Fusarium oxysporum f. sp. lycopersici 4287]